MGKIMKDNNTTILIKALVTVFLVIITSAAETSLFPYMRIFGAVPSVLIYIVAALAVFEGPMAGLLCGFLAGFFTDGAGGQSLSYYTFAMMFSGVAAGLLSPSMFKKRMPTALGWGAALWFVIEFLRFFVEIYMFGHAGLTALFSVLFPAFFASLIFAPLFVWPISAMYRRMKKDPGLFR